MAVHPHKGSFDPFPVAPVFVVGAPRSGTTLLQNLIACHPDAGTAPETHIFIKLTPTLLYERNLPPIGKRAVPETLRGSQVNQLSGELFSSLGADHDPPVLATHYHDDEEVATRAVAGRFFSALAQRGKHIFIEKSPPHVFFTAEIMSVIPEAKIIHIIRDPRDVVPSINRMLQHMGKKPRTVYERAKIWKSSVAAAQSARLFTVRYEDLVSDTHTVMKQVFTFLDLSYSPDFLSEHSRVSEKTVKKNEIWKAKNFSDISPDRIGRFRQSLNTNEIGMIEAMCGRLMLNHGYQTTDVPSRAMAVRREAVQYHARRARMLLKRGFSSVQERIRGNR